MTDRLTDENLDWPTMRHATTHTYIQKGRQAGRHAGGWVGRQAGSHTDMGAGQQANIQTGGQADWAGRQTDRQDRLAFKVAERCTPLDNIMC